MDEDIQEYFGKKCIILWINLPIRDLKINQTCLCLGKKIFIQRIENRIILNPVYTLLNYEKYVMLVLKMTYLHEKKIIFKP